MTNVPDSNNDWKSRYFFIQGSNWVCRPDKWDNIREEYDSMWDILDESSESSVIVRFVCTHCFILTLHAFFFSLGVLDD